MVDACFQRRVYRRRPPHGLAVPPAPLAAPACGQTAIPCREQALVAVTHQLLEVIYHILTTGDRHHELGADHDQTADPRRTVRPLAKRLERLGFTVTLAPAAKAG